MFSASKARWGIWRLPDNVSIEGQGVSTAFELSTACGDGFHIVYANGDQYIGNLINGQRNGFGLLQQHRAAYFASYRGEWKNSQYHGFGTYSCENGVSYEGEYKFGLKDGFGKEALLDRSVYEGHFVQDQYHGLGKKTWANGHSYIGSFVNGMMHGLDGLLVRGMERFKGGYHCDAWHGWGVWYVFRISLG